MNRRDILHVLALVKPVLAKRYGVVRLALFGSAERDEARADSDVDVAVSFDGPATYSSTSASSFISKMLGFLGGVGDGKGLAPRAATLH